MSDNLPPPLEYQVYDPDRNEIRVETIQPTRRPYWLHALLFFLTIISTLCIGAHLQENFSHNLPLIDMEQPFFLPWTWALADWRRLSMGIPFSLCLLGILTVHELGHYVFCVRRGVYASWPYFIPAPTLLGTFGAFIRIKSPIKSRQDLFDIGIAGPLAGFLVAVPVLFLALLHSRPMVGPPSDSALTFGVPYIFVLAQRVLAALGSQAAVAHMDLAKMTLHPMALAAWVGMFATSLNLLPGGQLDGGHIVFAVNPRAHRVATWLAIVALLPLAWFFWAGWLLWAVVLRMTGHHPDVPSSPGLDGKRIVLAVIALVILALTMSYDPIPGASLQNFAQETWEKFSHK